MDVKKGHCWRCETAIKQHSCTKCSRCGMAVYCSSACRSNDAVRHGSVECEMFGPHSCNHCGKSGNVKECSACNRVWYCNPTCQKANWTTHKTECKKITEFIKDMAPILNYNYEYNGEHISRMADPPAYFGNTIAVDFMNLAENELSGQAGDPSMEQLHQHDFNLLSAGCGDLRNTVLTISSLPMGYRGKVHLTLDDFDPFVMARNVLFLFMMARHADRDDLASSLATIWYSLQISQRDYDLVRTSLDELITSSASNELLREATDGLLNISPADLDHLREVWEGWLKLQCRRRDARYINLKEQRRRVFEADSEARWGLPQYLVRLNASDSKSMQKWFKRGLFIAHNDDVTLTYDNPTLTGRPSLLTSPEEFIQHGGSIVMRRPSEFPFQYCIRSDSSPFQAWDCLNVDAFIGQQRPGLSATARYHAYVTHHLRRTVAFIGQRRLNIRILLANCLDLPNYKLTLTLPDYDRIFTSNMADYFGFSKLLATFKPMLNAGNSHSMIVTQTLNWVGLNNDADVQFSCDVLKYQQMCQRDTGFNLMTSLHVNNQREYFNNVDWLLAHLRADMMAGGIGLAPMDHVPKLSEVLCHGGMQMVDFRKVLNKFAPFQYRVNARRVTMENGMTRNVEWRLSSK